jgi:hypothetical protein
MKPERNIEQESAGRQSLPVAPMTPASTSDAGYCLSREALETWLEAQLAELEARFGDWTTPASVQAACRRGR